MMCNKGNSYQSVSATQPAVFSPTLYNNNNTGAISVNDQSHGISSSNNYLSNH